MKRKILMIIIALMAIVAVPAKLNAGEINIYGNPYMYKVTAYCPCMKCCGKIDGITASGKKAREGVTVAVDPRQIPYGSTVLIYYQYELVGIYEAEDCGGAIKGNWIDLFFDSHEDALEWGVKECEVYIFEGAG